VLLRVFCKIALLGALVLAVSCATSGEGGGGRDSMARDAIARDSVARDSIAQLPQGAVIYGFVDIDGGTELLQELYPVLFDDKRTADFIKRTKTAVFGVYRSEKPSVFAITNGAYPLFRYNLGFSLSPDWKSEKLDGEKWWKSGNTALLIRKHEALLTLGASASTNSLAFNSTPPKDGASSDDSNVLHNPHFPIEENTALSLSLSRSEAVRLLKNAGFPLELPLLGFTLSILHDAEDARDEDTRHPWLPKITIETGSASEAKAVYAIFSLARMALAQGKLPLSAEARLFTEVFFDHAPLSEGTRVTIFGATVDEGTLALLAEMVWRPSAR
jgi:hypothetical protein